MIGQMIDTLFHGFDMAILGAIHQLAVQTNNGFKPLCEFFSFFFDYKGIPAVVLVLCFIIYKPTRKVAFCVLAALACGAVIVNFGIKHIVMRPRPYNSGNPLLLQWWQFAGSHVEGEFSFPSGHTSGTMAIVLVIVLMLKKKWTWWLFLLVPVMAFSRNYLMVHYPSDVVAGMLTGLIVGYLGYRLGLYIYEKYNLEERFQ